jgi:hypothetical protein
MERDFNVTSDLTDGEIDNICAGYVQNAAKVRHLRAMGLTVRQKPNGRPLVNRSHYDAVTGGQKKSRLAEPVWSIA